MWSSQQTLSKVINDVIINKKFELVTPFQEKLNNVFENLLDILKDKPQSLVEREKVQKSKNEPIQIGGNVRKILASSLIEEALTLSDLFNISELNAVELLLEAEEQMQYFHGFNRGHTAILLYYDTKKLCINNLRTLLFARPGRTWCLDENIPSNVMNFLFDFVGKLLDNGLISNLLSNLLFFDWSKAEENLSRVNGLGSLKHKKQVKSIFDEIRLGLAESIFNIACQTPLDHKNLLLVINFLKNNCQTTTISNKQTIDPCYLYLIMAVLYCFDCSYLENRNNLINENKITGYLTDDFMKTIHTELKAADFNEWHTPGIKALFQFSFQIFVSLLSSYLSESDNITSINISNITNYEEEDILIDKSIENKVFKFLRQTIIQNNKFRKEKFFVERIHKLITDFIYKMPEKIKEMRNKNEEVVKYAGAENSCGNYINSYLNTHQSIHARIQNISAEIIYHDFEEFLNLIGDFYVEDPLNLELNLNFWVADNELNVGSVINYNKPSLKQISLYKFVRYFLSDDALISRLYIAYINMLTGLCTGEESAQHCFVLLQSNSHFYETQTTKISWDHIFFAYERYYDSFKADLNQFQPNQNVINQVTAQIRSNRGITQQEIQGLISVTKLVNKIAMSSEKVRLALCEYQRSGNDSFLNSFNNTTNWDINGNTLPSLMFGLLGCPIPIRLKGEILQLLASFSLTPMIGANMWLLIENSQLIPTIQSTNSSTYPRQDLKVELEEIESREETYPLLRGFVHLIRNLIYVSNVPENLGIGIRPKNSVLGFLPYLQFLVNNVYLKLFYRSYKNPEEKWIITNELLEIFYLIVFKFDLKLEDIKIAQIKNDPININSLNSPFSNSPGFKMMNDLIHDGPVLRMLFFIINESLNHLLEYNNENDPFIENSSLLCLKIITIIIEKQKAFIDQLKCFNHNIDNCGLEKFIIAINPSTNKSDYLLGILRFIQFNSTLVQHSYYSLNIIFMLSSYSIFNSQFLNLFMKSCLTLNEQCELMNSFVEFIEYYDNTSTEDFVALTSNKYILDYSDFNENDDIINGTFFNQNLTVNHKFNTEEMRSANRLRAIKFILFYLRLPAPNIAHVLLGFDIHKPFKYQTFFNPGTKINYATPNNTEPEILSIVPRTCLHSIINILNKYLKNQAMLNRMGTTIDCCYELLFILCSNFQFNQQLLNYLRKEYDLIYNNLKKLPFIFELNQMSYTDNNQAKKVPIILYSHYTWIINLSCIEIQSLLTNRMRNELKNIVQLLIEPIHDKIGCINQQINTKLSNNEKSLPFHNNSSSYFASKYKIELDDNKKDHLDPSQHKNDDFLENNKIFELFSVIDFTQKIPEILELSYFDPNSIEKVIETCKYVPEHPYTNIQLYDLKKLKHILINEIKDSGINMPKANLLNEIKYILQNVDIRNNFQIHFIIKKKYLESFRILVESLVMIIPTEIFSLDQRKKFLMALIIKIFEPIYSSNSVVELTYSLASILFTLVCKLRLVFSRIKNNQFTNESNNCIFQNQSVNFNLSNLSEILSKLIDYLLNPSLTNFKVRTHLYGTILNYLIIFDENSDNNNLSQKENIENLKIISSNSNSLLKIICSDSCEGVNITSMLGLSLLNKLIDIDSSQKWIKFISDKGYLLCLINTIQNSDNQLLEECFLSQHKSNKIIYITETKLSFLMSISKTNLGAQLLLKNGLINTLCSCSIFSLRSKFDRNLHDGTNNQILIQLLHQFYQIFFPALKVCISIINSMGWNNVETKSAIAKFILTHSDSFLHILTCKISDIKMLEELKLVTIYLCKLAPFDLLSFNNLNSNIIVEHKPIFNRIHKELLNQIFTFFIPEKLKQIKKEIEFNSSNQANKEIISKKISHYCAEIASNICSYCTNITKLSPYNNSQLIFSPKFEIHQLHPYSPLSNRLNTKYFKLSLLTDYLYITIENLEKLFEMELDLLKKQQNICDLILIEKKQIISQINFELFEKLTESEKHFCLKNELKSMTKSTRLNIKTNIAIIEKCLFLLWRHIEFYLAYFETNTERFELYKSDFFISDKNDTQNSRHSDENSLRKTELSKEEFIKFRQDLVNIINSNFWKRFSIIEKESKSDNFINVLLKRIQKLIHLHNNSIIN